MISLHCPLTDENYHLLNREAFDQMKDGVMVINTSRGALIDSQAAIDALLGDLHPGQRPADFVNIQRVDHPPARTQQRTGVKSQLRADQRPAELSRQRRV